MHNVESALFHGIVIEPVVINVESITLKTVAEDQTPYRNTGEHFYPGHTYAPLSGTRYSYGCVCGMDNLYLLRVYAGMLFRPVRDVPVPPCHHNESERGGDGK